MVAVTPLAMPTYIAAYVFAEFLDKAGPFYQKWVSIFGSHAWYPSLNSLGGAIFTLSIVLYPYVYMSARTGFINQSAELMQAGRLLGASHWVSFRQIALPLSRPMIIVGVALALMECLNDIGAVEHLGVKTLTVGVYETWLSRGSLEGAARIAMLLLGLMALLLLLERYLRAGGIEQKSNTTSPCFAQTFATYAGCRSNDQQPTVFNRLRGACYVTNRVCSRAF